MNRYKIKLVVIILILFMAGCTEKDDLTLPVRIQFKVGFSRYSKDHTWELLEYEHYIEFTEGYIFIQKIQFEGIREAGGDVFFETDPEINLPTTEFGGLIDKALVTEFDIPQGIYNSMKWDIYLRKTATDELIGEDDTDLLYKGIVIKGTIYQRWFREIWGLGSDSSSTIQIIFVIDDTELISIRSYPDIAISNDRVHEAILRLDPNYAFDPISEESIKEAEISSDINGDPLLIISSSKNKNLYEMLLYRISQIARVLII